MTLAMSKTIPNLHVGRFLGVCSVPQCPAVSPSFLPSFLPSGILNRFLLILMVLGMEKMKECDFGPILADFGHGNDEKV